MGLVRAGFDVTAMDPRDSSVELAQRQLASEGAAGRFQRSAEIPRRHFDVAVFAETSDHRWRNFDAFSRAASADRYLIEKPLSADPAEVEAFAALGAERGLAGRMSVNFTRRAWTALAPLVERCQSATPRFEMTMTSGAIGLGCNGIHFLDLFLLLSGGEMPAVRYARLDPELVPSGRGAFPDFGGTALLEGTRGTFFLSCAATSSAPRMLTVQGDHFRAWIDDHDGGWRMIERAPDSALPNYRYGADYRTLAEGRLATPSMEDITRDWSLGKTKLASLPEALAAHNLLFAILRAGGARPPYRFT